MRGHNKPTPTCLYYEHKDCAKPKECPVHGPILDRPRKKRHLLRAELETNFGQGTWHRTLCGIWLHKRLEFGVGPNTTWEKAKGDHRKSFELQQKIEFSGFRLRLPPSKDPDYEVFLEVGYSHKEVLCTTGPIPDCKRCKRAWPMCAGFKFPEKAWDKTIFETFMTNEIDNVEYKLPEKAL